MNLQNLTREELIALLDERTELAQAAAQLQDELLHELEVHQTELEMQNSQLRDAQVELEESRAQYADLYDFAPIAYVTLDEAGCIVQINLAGATLLRRERSVLIGMPLATLLPEAERGAFRNHVGDCLRGVKTSLQVEIDERFVQVVSAPYRDRRSGLRRCRTVLFDVTDERRAENAMRLSLRMREDFLAIVSHELRNPLNAVAMAAQLLRHDLPESDRRRNGRPQLDAIQRACGRMERLLVDLLDLSSMDAGQLAMRMGEHWVSEVVELAFESVTPLARKRDVRLVSEIASDELLRCDRDRVVQVLVNLLSNAAKYTAAGGRVVCRVEAIGEELVVSIIDDGIGIGRDQLTQIFAPYWQVDRLSKRGTGLGLSIARGIVEEHGGTIGVRSDVGVGSTFFFHLPRIAQTTAQPNDGPVSSSSLSRVGMSSTTLLVVDDEEDCREPLAELLRQEGFRVLTARDGEEALERLRDGVTPVHLVLLDLVMPGVDGWQFLGARAADPQLMKIPVVLISGQVDAAATAASLGLAGVVEKPIHLDRLRALLEEIVPVAGQSTGGEASTSTRYSSPS